MAHADHVDLENSSVMETVTALKQRVKHEGVSNPQDCCMDRKMDGCIGATWWFRDSNKRHERIGRKMNGQRTGKVECVNSVGQRKL